MTERELLDKLANLWNQNDARATARAVETVRAYAHEVREAAAARAARWLMFADTTSSADAEIPNAIREERDPKP